MRDVFPSILCCKWLLHFLHDYSPYVLKTDQGHPVQLSSFTKSFPEGPSLPRLSYGFTISVYHRELVVVFSNHISRITYLSNLTSDPRDLVSFNTSNLHFVSWGPFPIYRSVVFMSSQILFFSYCPLSADSLRRKYCSVNGLKVWTRSKI